MKLRLTKTPGLAHESIDSCVGTPSPAVGQEVGMVRNACGAASALQGGDPPVHARSGSWDESAGTPHSVTDDPGIVTACGVSMIDDDVVAALGGHLGVEDHGHPEGREHELRRHSRRRLAML